MPPLLQLQDAHKRYGDKVLLDGADLTINDDAKYGLIGRNGAGKSTMARVLLGEEELEAGEVIRSRKLRLGYLRQHDPFLPGETVEQFLMRDSGQPDWRCGAVAAQFELKGPLLEQEIRELSGGWQTRVKLTALLLHDPNLLLLDEPTNFLDLRTQLLLEEFLKGFNGGCLVISHDRTFLEDVCDHTVELSRGKLTTFPGRLEAFLEYKVERREHDERVNATVMTKRKQLEEFIAKNRANAATASQARSKAKQLERLETIHLEGPETAVNIRLPQVDPRKGTALACRNLSIGYPDHTVAEKIDLDIDHGARMAIVGDNGQGKTTFLRTVVESLPPLAGEFKWGHHCVLGVYAQHVYGSLPPNMTVQEYLERRATVDTSTQAILDVAGSFLFRGPEVEKKTQVLSGGERARLCLAGLLVGKHNVLVLDEPGNHLDVETLEALADALTEFAGTILFTSHDRHFMHRVATGVIEVRDGRVANYHGNYDSYLYRVGKEIADGARGATAATKASGTSEPLDKEARKKANQQRRELRKQASNLEKQIAQFDAQRNKLNATLLETTDAKEAEKLHRELTTVSEQLSQAEERWLELQEQMV